MNVNERREVVGAKLRNATQRIDRLRYPRLILEHVSKLRQQAEELISEAERIERELREDALQVEALIRERVQIEIELTVLDKLARSGVTEVSSLYIDNFVTREAK